MLRYFRINDPYRLLGLLFLVTLISLPLLIDPPEITYPELKSILVGETISSGSGLYTELVDSTAPLTGWFETFLEIIFGRSILARHILTLFIILFQAAYVGILFINKKAFSESTFIPALIFVILFFFSFDTLTLSAELLGSGVLLLALNNLFKQIEFREQNDGSIFNLGFFIGIASLFLFSFVIHLIGTVIILAIFSRSTVRGYLLLVFGFVLPHLLLMSVYFLNDGLAALWHYYYIPNLGFTGHQFMSAKSLWVLGALPFIFLFVSLVMLNREARFTKYQSQLVQTMFFWMIFSFLQALYSKEIRPQSFITLIASFSFFIAHFLMLIRRKKFAEISIWILLVGIVSVNYLTRYKLIDMVQYDRLFVGESLLPGISNKKVLVLDDNLTFYKHNMLGSPFLSWPLSREIFEHPEFYQNIIRVNESFKHDPPDVIIDSRNLMQKFFERIPELERKYVLVQPGVYEVAKR